MDPITTRNNFAVANRVTSHLVVHPADKALNPPESYLFVQDALIIATGTFWTIAYFWYTLQCRRDRRSGMPMAALCSLPAWELFYGIVIPSTLFEQITFLVWFFVDVLVVVTAIRYGHKTNRKVIASKVILSNLVLFALYWPLAACYPNHYATAYFTGLSEQVVISWGSIYDSVASKCTKGHSIEIWSTRFVGTFLAVCLPLWQFVNVPENWACVGNPWFLSLVLAWFIGDLLYPFIYYHVATEKVKDS